MTGDPFQFTYSDQQFETHAECFPAVNGYRNYRLAFPNVQSIVEGSVHVTETPEGEWLIDKFISVHPVPKEFLHCVSQGFVEFIDTQKRSRDKPANCFKPLLQ